MKFYALHFVFCVLLLAGSAWGQRLPGQTCSPRQVSANAAIVRVAVEIQSLKCKQGKCNLVTHKTWAYGTGTIFDQRGKYAYVLTAAHNLDGGRQVSVRVRNVWHGATIKHVDREWDVAVLVIADPGVTPIRLADKPPVPGESIELSGFGSGAYDYRLGRLTQFVGPGRGLPFEWMEVSAASHIGDSGGPMVNARGRLVGVISATGQGSTVGCCFPRIRAIVRGILPPYPNRPGVIVPKPIVVMPPPSAQPTPAPPVSVTTSILDYDKLAEAILAKIDLAALRGPVGPAGPAGPQGPPGKVGPQGPPASDGADATGKKTEGAIRIQVQPVPPN